MNDALSGVSSSMSAGMDETNLRFNERLLELEADPSQKNRTLHLGKAGDILLSAGITNVEIEMEYDKFVRKSGTEYKNRHPFEASDILDLPYAINNPIAVFNSASGREQVVLTELRKDGNNFIVAIKTVRQNRKGGVVIEVNEIATLFPKETRGIIDWINKGQGQYMDKQKALHWIEALPTHPGTTITNEELNAATKIVESFVNPTIGEGKITSAVDELSDSLNTSVNTIWDTGKNGDGREESRFRFIVEKGGANLDKSEEYRIYRLSLLQSNSISNQVRITKAIIPIDWRI